MGGPESNTGFILDNKSNYPVSDEFQGNQRFQNSQFNQSYYPKTAREGPGPGMSPYPQNSKYEDAPQTSRDHRGVFEQNNNWEGRFHPEDV